MTLTELQRWNLLPDEAKARIPKPPERKRRSQEESVMQRALLKWWAENCRHFGVPEILLASCPNGGGRSGPRVGAILKAEGLRAGFPDLGLYVPRKVFSGWDHSLFLELKRPSGIVSPEQEVFHQRLREQGYKVEVCRSLTECINTITAYLT